MVNNILYVNVHNVGWNHGMDLTMDLTFGVNILHYEGRIEEGLFLVLMSILFQNIYVGWVFFEKYFFSGSLKKYIKIK